MKRLNTMKTKNILLAQTGLALVLFLSGAETAAAQASPVSLSPTDTPTAPATSIDAPMPGTAAPAAAATAAPAAPVVATQPATAQPAIAPLPATSAVAPVTTTVAAPVVATPTTALAGAPVNSSTAPVAQESLPTASKAEAASQPSAAELAVVHNAGTQPAAPVNNITGTKVTDVLTSTPATVRPLPKDYLIVKKEHNANDFDARLMAARSALAQGSYQAALEMFDDLYRKTPTDMRVQMGRAVALEKLGQTDEAMNAYQGVLRKDPRNVEAMTNMLGMLKGKDAPTAIRKLQQLRDLYPANADVVAQLGMVYGVAGDYGNAIKYLDMADSLKPGNPTVLYNRAVAYDHMGNTPQAATLYRQILLLASDGDLDESFPLDVVRQRLATMR